MNNFNKNIVKLMDMDLLLLAEKLKNEKETDKNDQIAQHLDCLFDAVATSVMTNVPLSQNLRYFFDFFDDSRIMKDDIKKAFVVFIKEGIFDIDTKNRHIPEQYRVNLWAEYQELA